MKISVLSGKGGTGKTLLSVNLAALGKSTYIDCDVEEPNGHIFFKPENLQTRDAYINIPKVEIEKCTGCEKCVDFCKFNALAYLPNNLLIFEEVCHFCNGCIYLCPEDALYKDKKVIGKIQEGTKRDVVVKSGFLNEGESSSISIIKELLKNTDENLTIIDCPPGSACIVMESIKDSDYCILVGEPTSFGLENFKMIYELVTLFNKPFGVVLNKVIDENNPLEKYCLDKNIDIIGKIGFDKEINKISSDGEILVYKDDKYKKLFSNILNRVEDTIKRDLEVK